MSKYVEALSPGDPDAISIFLAGSITGAEDWQRGVADKLLSMSSIPGLQVLNPRRANFPIDDPNAAAGQILWEARHLDMADVILFWFSEATLGPITLYELGAWSMTEKPLVVATHPNYARRQDVVIQTALRRPEIEVRRNLQDLIDDAVKALDKIA